MAPYTNDDVDKLTTPGSDIPPKEQWLKPPKPDFSAPRKPTPPKPAEPGSGVTVTGTSTLTGKPTRDTIYPGQSWHDQAVPLPLPDVMPAGAAAAAEQPAVESPYTGPWPEPERGPVTPVETLPAILSRGKYGEPVMTNQAGAKPVAPGVQPVTLRPAHTDTLPSPNPVNPGDVTLKRDEGDYNPYTGEKTSLKSMEGTGTLPGGQVITPTMDAETQKLVDARKAEGSAALDSYNHSLDEQNILEGAHGPAQANRARAQIQALRSAQMRAFADKYGLNLKTLEFQATLPKLAAEADLARAHAGYFNAGGPAGAAVANRPNSSEQQLLDMSKGIAHQLTDPIMSESLTDEQREKLQSQFNNIHEMLGQINSAKKPTAAAKPARADFIAKAKQANPGYSDAEIAAEYDKRYGGK